MTFRSSLSHFLLRRVDQFMSLSFATEPRRRGMFEPYFWTPTPSLQQQTHPLLALMMPEPLPSIALIDRAEVIRGRTESSSNTTAPLRKLLPLVSFFSNRILGQSDPAATPYGTDTWCYRRYGWRRDHRVRRRTYRHCPVLLRAFFDFATFFEIGFASPEFNYRC
jgi:hypothetical protein